VRAELEKHRFIQSMSRKGDCWDNAVMESFFHSLKAEHTYFERYLSRAEARSKLFDYIEELSALSISAELPNSPEIAQICLKNRNKLAYCDSRTFNLDILPQLDEGMSRVDLSILAGLNSEPGEAA